MKVSFIRHAEGYHNLSKKNWQITSPSLTSNGINQCKTLKNKINNIEYDLIVVSPLLRTLQTAEELFNKNNKFISMEWIKEAVVNPCDFRESKKESENKFPYVNFDLVNDNFNYNKPESEKQIIDRCDNFYNWLLNCKEKNIAIVTHGQFLKVFLNKYGKKLNINNIKWFNNCELRKGYIYKF